MVIADGYDECLRGAERRYASGDLRLCPRGYCTAKHKFDVYPSAYANGYATQVCKGGKPDWRGDERADARYSNSGAAKKGGLARWYKEKWVNVCEKRPGGPGGYAPCGSGEGVDRPDRYPYCRPLHRLPGTTVATVRELTEAERARMCRRKRSLPQGVGGRPTRVVLPADTRSRVRSERARQKKRGKKTKKKTTKKGNRGAATTTAFPWLPLREVERHVAEARRLGVSKAARSRRGFVAAYRRHRTSARMRAASVQGGGRKETWGQRRATFLKGQVAQYAKKPTHRRLLTLRMWAYEPPSAS